MSNDAHRIAMLRREIERHNRLYYVEARAEISDQAFDKLLEQLQALERRNPTLVTSDSPTQRVGGEPITGFRTVKHARRMYSIDNTYRHDDLLAWHERVVKGLPQTSELFQEPVPYVLEPKIDGVAVSLRYEKEKLVLATSRGDGEQGDDLTHNIRTIGAIPLRLTTGMSPPSGRPAHHKIPKTIPAVLEVRGEVYMHLVEFERINRKRIHEGQEPYANPRNVTAGTLKQLDSRIVAQRRLMFVAHGRGEVRPDSFTDHSQFLAAVRAWGIPTNPRMHTCLGIEAVRSWIDQFEDQRESLGYEIDGVVVKVDRYDLQTSLGATAKSPRWCIAYKYAAQQATTVLKAITWQVGKGGTLTPVAELEPVLLAGTTVKRAGLHNLDEIRRKDIRVADQVVIEKAGEIIPQVVKVVTSRRKVAPKATVAPDRCPSCGERVIQEDGQAALRCVNPQCPAQLCERLIWFAARGQMDIDGLGAKAVHQLVEAGFLTSFSDLYRLENHRDQLVALDRMGQKKVEQLLRGIQRSKGRGLSRLLAGLGIRHVGQRAAQILASQFGSMDRLMDASIQQLGSIHDIGPVTAESIHRFLHSPIGKRLIKAFRRLGLDMTSPQQQASVKFSPFAGKRIVLTGTLSRFDRDTLKVKLESLGAKVTGSVSKKTDLLIVGENPGRKLQQARGFQVDVWDERMLLQHLGDI